MPVVRLRVLSEPRSHQMDESQAVEMKTMYTRHLQGFDVLGKHRCAFLVHDSADDPEVHRRSKSQGAVHESGTFRRCRRPSARAVLAQPGAFVSGFCQSWVQLVRVPLKASFWTSKRPNRSRLLPLPIYLWCACVKDMVDRVWMFEFRAKSCPSMWKPTQVK